MSQVDSKGSMYTGEDQNRGRRGQDTGTAVTDTDQVEKRTAAESLGASATLALEPPQDLRLAAIKRLFRDRDRGSGSSLFGSQPSLPSPIPKEKNTFLRVLKIMKCHRVHTIRSLVSSLQDGPCTDSSFSAWNPQRLQHGREATHSELVQIYLRSWYEVPNDDVYFCPLCDIWLNIGQRTHHRNARLHRRKRNIAWWSNITASLATRRQDIM